MGSVVSENVAKWQPVLGAGLSVLLLKYSRDAEREADQLGFGYALENGWDSREMADLFETLQRASETGGGGRLPDWLSTHPNPEDRLAWVKQQRITVDTSKLETNREAYLTQLDGLSYGRIRRDGFFRSDTFYHPKLALQVDMPKGWKTQDTPAAAVAVSPDEDAAIAVAFAGEGTPEQALKFLRENQVQGRPVQDDSSRPPRRPRPRASPPGSRLAGGGRRQLLRVGRQDDAGARLDSGLALLELRAAVLGEHEVRRPCHGRADPEGGAGSTRDRARLDRATPVVQLAARSTADAETLARLNAVEPGGSVGPGLAKLVVGGSKELLEPTPRASR